MRGTRIPFPPRARAPPHLLSSTAAVVTLPSERDAHECNWNASVLIEEVVLGRS